MFEMKNEGDETLTKTKRRLLKELDRDRTEKNVNMQYLSLF